MAIPCGAADAVVLEALLRLAARIRPVPTVTVAQRYTGTTGQRMVVDVCADAAMHLFLWDAASTAAHDGTTVIRPTAIAVGDPGRWLQDDSAALALLYGTAGQVLFYGADSRPTSDADLTFDTAANRLASLAMRVVGLAGTINRSVAVDADGDLNDDEFWDDLVTPATLVNLTGTPSPPTYNDAEITIDFSASATNTVQMVFQFPHAWAVGQSDVKFHVHYLPSNTNTGNIVWELKYRWTSIDATAGAFTTTTVTEAAPGVSGQHTIGAKFTLDGTGKGMSSCLQVQLQRLGGDAADTFTGLAQVMSIDLHYKRDSYGSFGEYTKT